MSFGTNHTYKRGDQLAVGDRVYAGNGYDEVWATVTSVEPHENGDTSFTTDRGTTGFVRLGHEILVKRQEA